MLLGESAFAGGSGLPGLLKLYYMSSNNIDILDFQENSWVSDASSGVEGAVSAAPGHAPGRHLPFPLTFGIISVCLDLAGLFRNKDIHLC
jgi:hypothetical protein